MATFIFLDYIGRLFPDSSSFLTVIQLAAFSAFTAYSHHGRRAGASQFRAWAYFRHLLSLQPLFWAVTLHPAFWAADLPPPSMSPACHFLCFSAPVVVAIIDLSHGSFLPCTSTLLAAISSPQSVRLSPMPCMLFSSCAVFEVPRLVGAGVHFSLSTDSLQWPGA